MKMEKLESKKTELKQQVLDLEAAEPKTESPVDLRDFKSFLASLGPLLNQLTPELKSEIVKLLVNRIEVFDDKVSIEYFVGEQTILGKQQQAQKIYEQTEKAPADTLMSAGAFKSPKRAALQSGSTTLKNGDPNGV